MIIIDEILISDDVVEEKFLCNLQACKGACCWEGDFGAPLEASELLILDDIYEKVKPFLSAEGVEVLESKGLYTYYEEPEEYGTTLINNGACAYLTVNELGIALCGIEQAYKEGVIDYYKPISCHLYPIRIEKEEHLNFEALNYDRWDICSAACTLGEKENLPIYRFVKEALIRKYGESFYHQLDETVQHLNAAK